jgi:CspA family cold shock protein
MERKTGCVKWFNARKGYGFITCDHDDVFVHQSSIGTAGYRYLVPGEYVEFTLGPVPNKPNSTMAKDVSGIARGPLMCETRAQNAPVTVS